MKKINTKTANSFKYIKNIAEDMSEATILIYKPVGTFQDQDGNIVEGVDGERFKQELLYLETQVDKINIRINSIGGSVYDGWAIISAILSSKAEIHTYNDGLAASIAAIILVAGDESYAMDYSLTMIHNPYGEENSEVVELVKQSLLTILTNRSILEQKEIDELMNEETYFTAQKAKDAGLIDCIVSSEKQIQLETQNLSEIANIFNKLITDESDMKKKVTKIEAKENVLEEVKNLEEITNKVGLESPTTLTNAEVESPEETESDPNEETEKELGEDSVPGGAPSLADKIKGHFGMKEDMDEEGVYDALKEHKAAHDSMKSENKTLQDKLEAIGAEAKKAHATKIDAMVNSYIKAGKLKESEKESTVKLALVDFDSVKNMLDKIGIVSSPARISSVIAKTVNVADAKSHWTIEDYWKNDPATLKKIEKEQPGVYACLIEDFKNKQKK